MFSYNKLTNKPIHYGRNKICIFFFIFLLTLFLTQFVRLTPPLRVHLTTDDNNKGNLHLYPMGTLFGVDSDFKYPEKRTLSNK